MKAVKKRWMMGSTGYCFEFETTLSALYTQTLSLESQASPVRTKLNPFALAHFLREIGVSAKTCTVE